jgi:hypothetical protein
MPAQINPQPSHRAPGLSIAYFDVSQKISIHPRATKPKRKNANEPAAAGSVIYLNKNRITPVA